MDTLTVKALIDILKIYPDDLKVAVEIDEYVIPLDIVRVFKKDELMGEKDWLILFDRTAEY